MADKAQALLLPRTPVRITKHRRRVGSEFAILMDLFWRENEPWIVLRLPSGQRTAIPASWTDLPSECLTTPKTGPEILPSALLTLMQYCQSLRSVRQQPSRSKNLPRNKK